MSETRRRKKPAPPVFHIPVGRARRADGEVVPFESDADQAQAMIEWKSMTLDHPDTQAAGACVMIGPTTTSFMDLRSRVITQSPTPDGAWKPGAMCDGPV